MSTLGQPHPEPAWKQEVSRRIAAHKHRKGSPAPEQPAPEQQHFGSSLAAQAAARVAARYSKAPSYSQMQAEEARLAVRAAEIATQVALEAQAAAHDAIADLHAAATQPQRGPAVVESIERARPELIPQPLVQPKPEPASAPAEPMASFVIAEPEAAVTPLAEPAPAVQTAAPVFLPPAPQPPPPAPAPVTPHVVDGQSYGIRWEPDTPVRVLQPKSAPAPQPFELETEAWWTPAEVSATLRNEPIAVEPEPAGANLIEFPRELVATRRMRPRLVEPAQSASRTERQLSIFEVDPGAVSTEPPQADTAAPAWVDPDFSERDWHTPAPASEWSGPEWSGIELDEQPPAVSSSEPEPAPAASRIDLAPFGRRLMAMAVDGCLILGAFFASAILIASHMQQLPAPRTAEALVAAGLALSGFLYNALFLTIGISTPGMRYAGIALSTFDDEVPTRTQLRRRLAATAVSLLPCALGMAWSVFDEDHLTWHDRISQTYLRKR